MKRFLLIVIALIALPQLKGTLMAQREDYSWYYGDHVGLRFDSLQNLPSTLLGNAGYCNEAAASICDGSGQLQFYIGQSVGSGFWNFTNIYSPNHQIMEGGDSLSFYFFSDQGAIIVPSSTDSSIYYLFTIGDTAISEYGWDAGILRYSLIDMNYNSGLGKVIEREHYLMGDTVFPFSISLASKIAATKHANGRDWWLLLHENTTRNYVRFLIGPNSIEGPYFQSIGDTAGIWGGNGEMTFSRSGSRLVNSNLFIKHWVEVMDFDRCTGLLSNVRHYDMLPYVTINLQGGVYGVEFSPNERFVYTTSWGRIHQIDLQETNPDSMVRKVYQGFNDNNNHIYGLQIGPDERIYVSRLQQTRLGIILNPDQLGSACSYFSTGVAVGPGGFNIYGLPNFPNYRNRPLLEQTAEAGPARVVICQGDSVLIGVPDTTGGRVTYAWEAHPDISDTTVAQVWVAPSLSTWYYLTVMDSTYGLPCGMTTDSILVIIADSTYFPEVSIENDTMICPGDSVTLHAYVQAGIWDFLWSTGSDSATTVVSSEGAYSVTVSNHLGIGACLRASETVVVDTFQLLPVLPSMAGEDRMICPGDTVVIGNAISGHSYHWNGGITTDSSFTMVTDTGIYILSIYNPTSLGGCFLSSDTVYVTPFDPSHLPSEFAGADRIICIGDSIILGTTLSTDWMGNWIPSDDIADASQIVTIAYPSMTSHYVLTITNESGIGPCGIESDTIVITVEQPFAHEAPVDVTFCPGECFEIGVDAVAGMDYRWSPTTGLSNPTASRTRAQPTATTAYTLTVTNPAMQSANCRERRFTVTATADACNRQSFIAMNGNGVAERLDLGNHAGRVELRVWDVAGRYVFRDMDYRNDWNAAGASGTSASRLSRGVYIYKVNVIGDCPAEWVGKIIVIN